MGSKPRHSTRSRGRSRPKPRSRQSSRKHSHRVPDAMLEHITGEVGRLYRASALLNVLEIATNYTHDDRQTIGDTWSVAQIARELISQTIDGLDAVTLAAAGKAGAK